MLISSSVDRIELLRDLLNKSDPRIRPGVDGKYDLLL